ncbi:substrate-binding domain-containing protein [Compostimonas suwonensis]|uniref:L-arabinose transport system substrate-binding protein n=1 Tax=Compostimonas suwonensis TaxID=1048394 RepID=A0A2M9C3N9_9MICO|nr:substrate-binding domain-containing protein [Compostimonas suwonensis]PJJ65153.1 L-arabinose transport system substrate-binding protein [Compostimonas suwonensis]
MKHRSLLTALTVAAAASALILTGCSNSADAPAADPGSTGAGDGPIKIGYIVKRGTDTFASDQVDAAKAAAAEAGVELVTADVKQDTGLTISTVNQMIASGIQGLIIVVPDQAIGPQVLELAAAKGIPVLASDDPIKDAAGKAAPFIGLDGVALGTQAGEQILSILDEHPDSTPENTAFVVVSQNSVSACTERTGAAIDAFNAGGGEAKATYIDVPHDGTLQTAVTAMSATITQNPNITNWYITSCNDDGVAGALRALEAKDVTKDNSFGIGMDGSLACTELAKDNGFVGANYVSFKTNGQMAFDSMYAFLKDGTAIPASQSIPGPLITRDNKAELAGC